MAITRPFKHQSASADLVIWGDGTATVSRLFSRHRKQGHATGVMRKICTYADAEGLTLVLSAVPFNSARDGLARPELIKFYEKFGFNKHPTSGTVYVVMDRQLKE